MDHSWLEHVPEAVCVISADTGELVKSNQRFKRSIVEVEGGDAPLIFTANDTGELVKSNQRFKRSIVEVEGGDAPLIFTANFIGTEDQSRFAIAVKRALEVLSKAPAAPGEAGSDMDDWLATPVVKECDTLAVGSSKGFPIWRRYDWALNALPDGKLIVVSGRMTTVVSEEKRAGEKDLVDFLNKAPIAMHWLSGTGHVLWANETEMNVLGYTAEEYIGQPIMNFCPDEKELVLEIFKTLGSGNTIKDVPVRFRTKGGEIKHLLIDSNVNWNTDGSFKHTRCFIRDDTARKVREARLSEMAHREKEVSEAKSVFVRKTFHEIRTPCHLLSHLLSQFEEVSSADEHERDAAFHDIMQQVNRLNRLVDDAVDAALFDSGSVPVLSRYPFNLFDLVNGICNDMERSASVNANVKRCISFRSQEPCGWREGLQITDDAVNPWFKGDAKKIGRVVEHLLDNAIKFTSQGTVSLDINLSAGEEGEDTLVILTVQDSGPGFNEMSVQMAFSKYWQDTSSIIAPAAGTKAQELESLMSKLSAESKDILSGSVAGSDPSATTGGKGSSQDIGGFNKQGDYEEVTGLGVGLNVINNIVQCMGGSLEFETRPGETTFVVAIGLPPSVPPTATDVMRVVVPENESKTGRKKKRASASISGSDSGSAGWTDVSECPAALKHVAHASSTMDSAAPTIDEEGTRPPSCLGAWGGTRPPPVGLVAMSNAKPNALVVDDNMICLKVLSNLVHKLGCTVDTASNGLEAVQKVSRSTGLYDIIFMDLRMPVMDGMKATKLIRDINPRIPVVAFTAEVGDSVREECVATGFDGFIAKPAGKATVKAELERLVMDRSVGVSIM
eukprot:CAMPEP_0174951288 /NCGR_PEP_ID=MMETSP1355-20121228/94772_1 /TAXON_ID=464990 /ORGANISM="Hemiselmis tepida, Strain CCMP443" /LENGTH=841 /DNA_ID=CAMNT_0016198939 /DNA_START=211 /DNA_END=2736 /DNA_ORIENTATION=+